MGKVNYNEEDFQKAAIQFKNDLLPIPVLSLKDSTCYMSVISGVRYEELVGSKSTNAKFRPAGRKKAADQVDLNLALRKLKTFEGELTAEFDPNTAIQLLIGHRASQASGDGLKDVPSAKEVLALIAKDAAQDLVYVIWSGKLDEESDDIFAICDGFDTITEEEISKGNIAEAKKNLLQFKDEITEDNILDLCQQILDNMDIRLRRQECFLFCPQWFADMYNRAYKKNSAAQIYNKEYEQLYVEGSNRKLTIAPVEGKEGSPFLHITPKANILIGCDQESDLENVKVKEYSPRLLTFLMDLFLGCQFRAIDSTSLFVVKHSTRVASAPEA